MNDFIYKKAQKVVEGAMALDIKEPKYPRTMSDVFDERIIERAMESEAPSTGYPELDNLLLGFVPGHLYTLTGQTNVGKTSLACNFAERISRQGRRVLYFALEPENTVIDYLASVRLDKKFRDLTNEDLDFDDGTIHICGKNEVKTLDDLTETIMNVGDAYDLIIVDHIGYFISSLSNTNQEQSNTVKKLAGLAKTKKTAIMLIAHLRKSSTKQVSNIPTMDEISGSAAFKQDSTDVLIATRNMDEEGVVQGDEGRLYVLKTKSGRNGVVDIAFAHGKALITTLGEYYSGRAS